MLCNYRNVILAFFIGFILISTSIVSGYKNVDNFSNSQNYKISNVWIFRNKLMLCHIPR